jgi:hypothetical protein
LFLSSVLFTIEKLVLGGHTPGEEQGPHSAGMMPESFWSFETSTKK